MLSRYPEAAVALAAALVATAALFAVGLGGWRGAPDTCLVGGHCFCERDRGGLVRQPANTASNLGFVLAGVGIGVAAGRARARGGRPRNPMLATRFYPAFYATLVALLGPGSMALHASLTRWGSVLDLLSMNLFITFVFLYGWLRWRGLTPLQFAASYAGLNLVLLGLKIGLGHGSAFFGLLAVGALAIELAVRRSGRVESDGRWIAAAAGLFGVAFAIWLGSHNDGPLCSPTSLLQGHGVWHLLCAASTVAIYGYACSERPAARAAS